MPSIFLSYSHKDESWRKDLEKHLRVLEVQGLLDLWDDRRISPGADWFEEIQKAMGRANVAVLLVSADFLTSKFALEKEVPRLLQRRQEEGLTVVPVIVRPCAWQEVGWLQGLQVRPGDGQPLSGCTKSRRETLLTSIAADVRSLVQNSSSAVQRPINAGALKSQGPEGGKVEDHHTSPSSKPADSDNLPTPHMRRRCFVCMPLVDELEDIYEIIKGEVQILPGTCSKADDTRRPGMINEKVIYELLNADLVIAVITNPREISSIDPNVMYALGIAHSFRKPTILVADNKTILPFDIRAIEVIQVDFLWLKDTAMRAAFLSKLREALRNTLRDSELLENLEKRRLPRNPVTTQLSDAHIFVEDLPWLWGYCEVLKREREAQTVWEISRDLYWPSEVLFLESIKVAIVEGKKRYFIVPDEEAVARKIDAIKNVLQHDLSAEAASMHLHFVAIDRGYFALWPVDIVLYDAESPTRRSGIICEPMEIQFGNDAYDAATRKLFTDYVRAAALDTFLRDLLDLDWLRRWREATFDIRLDGRVVASLATAFARIWNEKIWEEASQTTSEEERFKLLKSWLIGG